MRNLVVIFFLCACGESQKTDPITVNPPYVLRGDTADFEIRIQFRPIGNTYTQLYDPFSPPFGNKMDSIRSRNGQWALAGFLVDTANMQYSYMRLILIASGNKYFDKSNTQLLKNFEVTAY